MKNEPIIAYNHLQEEQDEISHSHVSEHDSYTHTKWNWRILINPVAIVIEVAAIIAMAIFMITEMVR